MIINDVRDYLRLTKKKFDVISTDVTNLQYKGNSNLYTSEYFSLMKSHLTEDGIACAWIPLLISTDEVKILLRTFQLVYPHTSLWFMDYENTDYAILIGTPAPLKIDLKRLEVLFNDPEIKRDLYMIGIKHPYQVVNLLYLDERGTRKFAGNGPLHTDDRPILEFSSPLSYYTGMHQFSETLDEIFELKVSDMQQYVSNLEPKNLPLFTNYAEFTKRWAAYVRLENNDKSSDEKLIALLKEMLVYLPGSEKASNALKDLLDKQISQD